MNRKFSIWLPLIMAVILALGIEIGLMLNGARSSRLFSNNKSNVLSEVLNYVQAKYVDTVNVGKLQDGVVEDVLEQLDPHSTFIPAKELRSVNQEVGSSRVDLQACKLEYSIVSPK